LCEKILQRIREVRMNSGAQDKALGVDKNFKFRNAYLLFVVAVSLLLLYFLREEAFQAFNFPGGSGPMRPMLMYRLTFIMGTTCIYIFSYTRDWHFEKIALITFAMVLSHLAFDLINIYSFNDVHIPAKVMVAILIRLGFLYCLLLNALRCDRSPAMPRHFLT